MNFPKVFKRKLFLCLLIFALLARCSLCKKKGAKKSRLTEKISRQETVKDEKGPKETGGMEELLLIRKTDSGPSDTMAHLMEVFLSHDDLLAPQPQPEVAATHDEEIQDSKIANYTSIQLNENAENSTTDFLDVDDWTAQTCSDTDTTHTDQQLCGDSVKQYDIEPRFATNFLDTTRQEMEEWASIPQVHPEDTQCNYRKEPGHKVNQRALCPFNWTITDNEARLPRLMYHAQCTCQVSRWGDYESAVCKEVMAKVRVMWRERCVEGAHRYVEGWEEVAVACVPNGQVTGKIKSKPARVIHGITVP